MIEGDRVVAGDATSAAEAAAAAAAAVADSEPALHTAPQGMPPFFLRAWLGEGMPG